jgi:hypothetical protein
MLMWYLARDYVVEWWQTPPKGWAWNVARIPRADPTHRSPREVMDSGIAEDAAAAWAAGEASLREAEAADARK